MEPEKTAPVLARNIYVAPLPPRGWRRAADVVQRWWRRLWRIDLDHLTDGWTELGYVEDDGLSPFMETVEEEVSRIAALTDIPELRITFHESDVSPDLWALLFGRAPKHRNDTWPVDWSPVSRRRYVPERPRPAHRAPKHRAEGRPDAPAVRAISTRHGKWQVGRTAPAHRKDDQ